MYMNINFLFIFYLYFLLNILLNFTIFLFKNKKDKIEDFINNIQNNNKKKYYIHNNNVEIKCDKFQAKIIL